MIIADMWALREELAGSTGQAMQDPDWGTEQAGMFSSTHISLI